MHQSRTESPPSIAPDAATPRNPIVLDRFESDLPRGHVIGSSSGSLVRRGIDVERVISIDHGALRIEPLAQPGWRRAGLAYGPFPRRPGLAMAVFMDNGHHLSQSYRLKNWVRQCVRWFRGSDLDPPPVRLYRWLRHRPRMSFARKLRRWYASRETSRQHIPVRENLAVGFFPGESPANPVSVGNGMVIHASRVFDNGELWARVGNACASTCTGLQNLTTYFITVLRARGAVYYAAALPDAHGLGAYPGMRPVALDPYCQDAELFAGVHQAVLGEIGFTMDTRVHGVCIADLGEDFNTAHAADALTGEGSLDRARIGGRWSDSDLSRSPGGASAANESRAVLVPAAPSSLIHAIVEPQGGAAGILFRARDTFNAWEVRVESGHSRLMLGQGGSWSEVARADRGAAACASLQVVDHGSEFTITLDGADIFGRRFFEPRLRDQTGVGVYATGQGRVRDFEAHPRSVPIPKVLDMGPPWDIQGREVLLRDDFSGPRAELAGHRTTVGNAEWRRDIGKGTFEIVGDGSARVNASVGVPSPGRTIYTVPWDRPEFADIDLEMTPPGTRRGENHRSRSGIVFWQDRLNYFMLNLWLHDDLETTSISTFFCINGFDDLYDAIWTCTGPKRMTWGVPFRLRTAFDGNHFLVRVNGEPVLHRTLTDVYPREPRMRINRVGLLANWEWGTDTGTVFRDFTVRAK